MHVTRALIWVIAATASLPAWAQVASPDPVPPEATPARPAAPSASAPAPSAPPAQADNLPAATSAPAAATNAPAATSAASAAATPHAHPALGWLIRSEAITLLAVSAVHFAVMPELDQMMRENLSADELAFFGPMFRLDHVVSGIFLAAMGFTTLFAANGIAEGKRWAFWVCLIQSAMLLTIPAAIVLTMGTKYFTAVPFASASAAITAVSASMWIPLLAYRGEFD